MDLPITPDILKKWMRDHHISRMQLADMAMVSKNTIDGWCSRRPISQRKQESLRLLMMEYQLEKKATSSPDKNKGFKITPALFTRQQWKHIYLAAKMKHMSPATFLKMSVFEACYKLLPPLEEK